MLRFLRLASVARERATFDQGIVSFPPESVGHCERFRARFSRNACSFPEK